MRRLMIVALLAASTVAAQTQASGTPVEIARSFQLPSRVLGESRTIDVTLPQSYATTNDRYPVLVVLDGESEQEIAAAITRFYASTAQLPPMIVVGVRNTNRSRDLTTAPMPGFTVPREAASNGGAANFLRFLETELAPHLDGAYRCAAR